ncbi:DUF2510 domain-containing protein [Ruicaihuangia caeni]|uniref:DUF2510 domain-containing protein n=1 Tax=Ruicaihuangia caeni TaxID=3042517 RepID=A0AAW6T9I7_9MICO|nr:DUF2510 domain-containing protein [Klugiella sp. YN-L-19]MDI2098433.1 DUF2510 domain-containing protein [Klugiella sp. YN-L-19]
MTDPNIHPAPETIPAPQAIPAGWYDDGSGGRRYWDGAQWTDAAPGEVAPAAAAAAAAAPSPAKPSVLGWIAFAAAIAGFVFACVPGALIVGWILLPVAFVLSIVAFFIKGKKWPVISALIISVVGTIVGFVVFFSLAASAFEDAFNEAPRVGSSPEVAAPAAGDAEEDAGEPAGDIGTRANPAPLGTTITTDEWEVVVNSVTLNADEAVLAANMFNEPAPDGLMYIIVNATTTYLGEDSSSDFLVSYAFVSDSGTVYTNSETLAVAPDPIVGTELYTGASATANTVLAIPVDAAGALRVSPGFFADEAFVAIQ